ncbi:MAG: VOC family protein, partial [Actinobacteria bacterium]|nr:VOC family protein [Actinomycetota bacterium]
PLAKYMEKNGEGIHHVGYRVANCDEVLEHVKSEGARVVDEHPRTGSRGTTVAFLHPKTAQGTLIELVEE